MINAIWREPADQADAPPLLRQTAELVGGGWKFYRSTPAAGRWHATGAPDGRRVVLNELVGGGVGAAVDGWPLAPEVQGGAPEALAAEVLQALSEPAVSQSKGIRRARGGAVRG